MCNCGNKRTEFSQKAQVSNVRTQKRAPVNSRPVYASFEYVGKTAVTIIGNVTGTQYRFNSPGNRQNIDYRDIPGITGLPVLKKVK